MKHIRMPRYPLRVLTCFLTIISTQTLQAQQQEKKIDAIIQKEMSERQIPGLQIAVANKDKITYSKSFGTAYLPAQQPVIARSIFPINSCTKIFSSVAIMQLVEQGKLQMDEPISAYLDSLPESWQKVSLEQLLTHTSGLPDLLKLLEPTGGLGALKTEQGLWQKLISLKPEHEPGMVFSYNQTNGYLLGKLIDKFSGRPFAENFQQEQFNPAAMSHTLFGDSRDVIPNYAPTYQRSLVMDGKRLKSPTLINNYYEFPYFRRTASGLNSTAEDLARWSIALLNNQFISKATRNQMWSPGKFLSGQPTPWALGWGIAKFRKLHPAFGMSGGSRAALLIYPNEELSVIVLTNLNGAYPEDFLEEIAAVYLPGILLADPITFLKSKLSTSGYHKVEEELNKRLKQDPGFKPSEFELNEWGYRLMSQSKFTEAEQILKLNTLIYPGSANAFDSYGEALLKNGKKELSDQMYLKSKALKPNTKH